MKKIIYTAPSEIEDEIDIIIELFKLGIDYLYIRKPTLDDFSIVDFVEKIPEKYWKKCISTSLIITKEFDLGGYHFTRDIIEKNINYNEKVIQWLHDNNKISSVSAHQLNDIKKYYTTFNHIIISPIFQSISKQNHFYNWNFDELIKINQTQQSNITHQLIAVGGINQNNINEVIRLKFNGFGLLGALWNEPKNAISNYKQIVAQINNSSELN